MANSIVTLTARKKMLRARAGEITLPKITSFVFGNGGVDEDGNVVPPQENQTELVSQLLEKDILDYTMLSDTRCRYRCVLECGDEAVNGKMISEIGLCDADGDIVAIKTFSAKGKDDDMEMTFYLEDSF